MAEQEKIDLIISLQRSFEQFREDEANSHLVLVASKQCLDHREITPLVEELTHCKNMDVLEFVGWELISIMSQDCTSLAESMPLLQEIAERCNPKEVCLGVVERMDSTHSSEIFISLLPILQKALTRLKSGRSKFIKMSLPQISSHLGTEKGRSLNHHVIEASVSFLDHLVQDVSPLSPVSPDQSTAETTGENEQAKEALTKCLVRILGHPLASTHLSTHTSDEMFGKTTDDENHRCHAQAVLGMLGRLQCQPMNLIEHASRHPSSYVTHEKLKDGETCIYEGELSLVGLSCYSYLVFVEEMPCGHIPKVYSNKYLLRINIPHIRCLLARTDSHLVFKGLALLSLLMDRLGPSSLHHRYLDICMVQKMAKELMNVMTLCKAKLLRQRAVKFLPTFLSKLDTRGRYMLLRCLLSDCAHAGVASLLIHTIKEEINQSLQTREGDKWFMGSQLISLMQTVYKLPPGAGREADLVPETERVMSALNCLRFILLRDKDDRTSVWANLKMIQKEFLEPLGEAVDHTRMNYRKELHDKEHNKGSTERTREDSEINFSVNTPDGESISMMPREQQCEALKSGLHALDMMECILSHIRDITSSR
ncbi:glomulin isoform X2 [Nematostella vectensis]|nr:glomulin isoform X2 [Nematostella vectensis]